jgi:hypothetical protein
MPALPTYQSRALPPVIREPRVPMRNPALEAIGQAGATLESIATKFGEQELRFKREAEITDRTTTMAQGLFEQRQRVINSSEFFSDPTGASNAYAKWTKQYQQQQLEGVKDPYVLMYLKRHFAGEALRSMDSVAELAARQSNNLAAGQMQRDIIRNKTMAEQTPDEKEGLIFLGRATGILTRMQNSGRITPEKAAEESEKMKSEFAESRIRALVFQDPQAALETLQAKNGISSMLRPDRAAQLEEMASKQLQRMQTHAETQQKKANAQLESAQNNKFYLQLKAGLPADPNDPKWDAAIEMAQNPPKGQLTVNEMGQSEKVAKSLADERQRLMKIQKDKEAARTGDFSNWISEQNAKGQPPSRDDINNWKDPRTGQPAPATARDAAIENIGKFKRPTPAVVEDIEDRITNHPFDDNIEQSIHAAFLSHKITDTEKKGLIKKLELWRNPAKSPALRGALAELQAKYPDWMQWKKGNFVHPDAGQAVTQFIRQFEDLVREQDLKPSQYKEQADKMLADLDRAVIGGHTFGHPLGGYHTGSSQDYYNFWGVWPEPKIAGNETSAQEDRQHQQPSSAEDDAPELKGIPMDDRVRLIRKLQEKDSPITSRNILKLWQDEQNGGR